MLSVANLGLPIARLPMRLQLDRQVLEIQTGLRGGMGPPITYILDGKQYISLMGGTGPVPPRGGGGIAAPPAQPPTPLVLPKLYTLVLDGKAPIPEANQQ